MKGENKSRDVWVVIMLEIFVFEGRMWGCVFIKVFFSWNFMYFLSWYVR